MRINRNIVLLLAALSLLFTGCNDERNVPEQAARLQLNLCIPVEGGSSAMRRVMGDPGKTETFQMPHYLYLIVMKEVNGVWSVWRREERTLNDEDWIPTHYWGLRMNNNDSIFKYREPINYILNNETPQGRVYAVCSKRKLTFNQTIGSISSMGDLLNWTFNTAPDSIQKSLQDIYVTPYNYTVDDDRYYCAFDCSAGNTSTVDLILYHVAAKVDLKWFVNKNVRYNKETPSSGVRLTYMEVRRLFSDYAYCFKPMRNELDASIGDGQGYDIPDIVTPDIESLWWEGRTYFYTIPYTVKGDPNHFPVQMQLCTNGTDKAYAYRPTLNMEIDTSAVFVPWLRANMNINAALQDKAATIEVPKDE